MYWRWLLTGNRPSHPSCMIPPHFQVTPVPKSRSSQQETFMGSRFSWKQFERALMKKVKLCLNVLFVLQPQLQSNGFLPAILPIWHFSYCQNSNLTSQLRCSFKRSTDGCRPHSPKQSSNSNPPLPAGGIWEPTVSGGSCFRSSWEPCVYPPLSPSSCYLLIVIVPIKVCLCSLGGFQSSDSRR